MPVFGPRRQRKSTYIVVAAKLTDEGGLAVALDEFQEAVDGFFLGDVADDGGFAAVEGDVAPEGSPC